MSVKAVRPRWQFSLRSFFLTVLIIGPIAGVAGPILLDSITEWKPPARPMPPIPNGRSVAPSTAPESYYESGETPLY